MLLRYVSGSILLSQLAIVSPSPITTKVIRYEEPQLVCDPDESVDAECDFSNEITVVFDEDHSYILDNQDTRDAFGDILLLWVNTRNACEGNEDKFYGVDFTDTAPDRSLYKKSGRGKGGCAGKKCPKTTSFGIDKIPNSPSRDTDPCQLTLLDAMTSLDPAFFADVSRVDVSFEEPSYIPLSKNFSLPVPNITTVEETNIIDFNEADQKFDDLNAVAISGDGSLLAVGYFDIKIYYHADSEWKEVFCIRSRPLSIESLSMSLNGQSLIASGFIQSIVFCRNGDSWSKKGRPIKENSRWQVMAWLYGLSHAISENGETIAVGYSSLGKVEVYTYNKLFGKWTSIQTFKNSFFAVPALLILGPWFGSSIAMVSNQENPARLIVGAPYDSTCKGIASGSVSIFDMVTGTRIQKILGEFQNAYLGKSVTVSSDGSRLAAVSVPFEEDGTVDLYEFNDVNSNYEKFGNRIYVFYPHVAMSGDGNYLVVGSPNYSDGDEDNQVGRTFLYDIETEDLNLTKTFIGRGVEEEQFGWSVAISSDGNILAIGDLDFSDIKNTYIYDLLGNH